MPRAKKDGQHLNCYIDRTLRERLDAYAEEKGQTLTMAIERLLTKALDAEEKKEKTEKRSWCPHWIPASFSVQMQNAA